MMNRLEGIVLWTILAVCIIALSAFALDKVVIPQRAVTGGVIQASKYNENLDTLASKINKTIDTLKALKISDDSLYSVYGRIDTSYTNKLNAGAGVFSSTVNVDTLNSAKGIKAAGFNSTAGINGTTGLFTGTVNVDSLKCTKGAKFNGYTSVGDSTKGYFTVNANDGVADNKFVGYLTNQEATAGRSHGLRVQGGATVNDVVALFTSGTASLLSIKGSGKVGINMSPSGATYDALSVVGGTNTDSLIVGYPGSVLKGYYIVSGTLSGSQYTRLALPTGYPYDSMAVLNVGVYNEDTTPDQWQWGSGSELIVSTKPDSMIIDGGSTWSGKAFNYKVLIVKY